MKSTSMDYLRGLVLLVTAIAMIGSGSLPMIADWGVPVSEQSDRLRTFLIPPGWAFSIWGIIFLGSLVFALSNFIPALTRSDAYRKVGWWVAALFTATATWQVWVPVQSIDLGSQIIILTCLTLSLIILAHIESLGKLGLYNQIVLRATFGLFAGWLTAASFVGSGAVFLEEGWTFIDSRSTGYALALLAVIAVVGFVVVRRIGGVFYAAGAGWALSALMVRHLAGDENMTVGIAAGLSLAVVLAGLVLYWSRRRSALAAA